MQGILQGRPGEDGLAADGRIEEALPDTLGFAEHGEDVDDPATVLSADHSSRRGLRARRARIILDPFPIVADSSHDL